MSGSELTMNTVTQFSVLLNGLATVLVYRDIVKESKPYPGRRTEVVSVFYIPPLSYTFFLICIHERAEKYLCRVDNTPTFHFGTPGFESQPDNPIS
jgi:hypothetical protein